MKIEKEIADKQLVEREQEHDKLIVPSVSLTETEYDKDDEFLNDVLRELSINEDEAEEQNKILEIASIEIDNELKAKIQDIKYRETMGEDLIPDEDVEDPDFWIETITESYEDEEYYYDDELFVDEDPTEDKELLVEMNKYKVEFNDSRMFVEEEKQAFELPEVSWDEICES